MNATSTFTWEEAKQVTDNLVFAHPSEHLKDVEMLVLQGSWEGLSYERMAEQYHLSVNYLRGDVGQKLWKKLSDVLGEEVNKNNFKSALERAGERQEKLAATFDDSLSAVASVSELPFPEGSVSLDSPFYLERDGVELLCYETIVKPGSLIRIKAPRLMGKTSLMNRILSYAMAYKYSTVYLDFSGVERAILTNLDKFLRWFCFMVGRQLGLENRLDDYWDTDILGSNDNCTVYFEEYLLAEINSPFVLGLDEVDRIFPYTEVIEDFFGMLRSWHEKGKISQRWQQLRLLMAHSTEVYISLDINQSPFNAGMPVELLEFDQKQVQDLAVLHGLNWHPSQVEKLMAMVGGHPYLVRLAMYQVSALKMRLAELLQDAPTEAGIYSNHLRRHLDLLQRGLPESQTLQAALQKVVTSSEPVELDSMQIYKLHSMGLVQRQDNHVMPRCNLYREYFRRVL